MRHIAYAVCAAMALSSIAAPAQPAHGDWTDARIVTVELSNFRFSPASIALEHGRRYRIHLVNGASGGHDFSAPSFFSAATVAPEDRARLAGGKVALHGGESVDIRLIAPAAGTYKVRCTHFMHGAFGMNGQIVVS